MRRAATVRHHNGHSLFTSGPPGPLPVVSSFGRDVSHQSHVERPDVHAHFQGRRSHEAVSATMPRFEVVLDAVADFARNLGRVFLGTHHYERLAHQPHIVVVLLRLLGRGCAVTVVAGTGGIRRLPRGKSLTSGAAFPNIGTLDGEPLQIDLPHVTCQWFLPLRSQCHSGEELRLFQSANPT